MYLTVRLAVLLAGSAASGVVVAGQILAGAAEVGHGIGEEVAASMDEAFLGGGPDPYAPVDQFPAAAPGALGTDPALDELARRCYTGDLQACDDLYLESPPLSDYEEYAFTCGGRVKYATVPFCTDLE